MWWMFVVLFLSLPIWLLTQMPWGLSVGIFPPGGNSGETNNSPTSCTQDSDCPSGTAGQGGMCFILPGNSTGACRLWQLTTTTTGCVSPWRVPTAQELESLCSGTPFTLPNSGNVLCGSNTSYAPQTSCAHANTVLGTTACSSCQPAYFRSATIPSSIGVTCKHDWPYLVVIDGKLTGSLTQYGKSLEGYVRLRCIQTK